MGHLKMSFRGICMHLNRNILAQILGHPVHRVIAVNAEAGASTEYGPLPPHVCWLETTEAVRERLIADGLPVDESGRFRLRRANLRVANPADTPVTVSLGIVPKLTDYSKDMILRPDLRLPGAPPNAGCFVDIEHGHVEAHKYDPGGGVYSTWSIETDGDPVLIIDSPAGSVKATLPSTGRQDTLSDGVHSSIAVHNDPIEENDDKNDFLLHYLAALGGIDAQEFPHGFPTVSEALLRSGGKRPDIGTTTSCSNSQYP